MNDRSTPATGRPSELRPGRTVREARPPRYRVLALGLMLFALPACVSENSRGDASSQPDEVAADRPASDPTPSTSEERELVGTIGKTVRIGSVDFWVDYDDALAYAKENQLLLWLHFGENPG